MNQQIGLEIIEDAINHGWTLGAYSPGYTQFLSPPSNFQCSDWCANFIKVMYNGQEIAVPHYIYDVSVRRTGDWFDVPVRVTEKKNSVAPQDETEMINHSLKFGWTMSTSVETNPILFAPQNFKCSVWCAEYINVLYNGQVITIPHYVFDNQVRTTGTW